MPEPLTQMERRVYHYLIDFLAENTFQPSIREIARQFRIKSTKTVSDILVSLSDKGYIERQEARSRGVRLIGYSVSTRTQPVPVYATVCGMDPALRAEHRESFVTLDRRFLPGEDVFLMRMRDDTQRARGIFDGDLVLVSPSAKAGDGDTVVLRHGADAVVRPFARDDGTLIGVVCGVFRALHDVPVEREVRSDD